MAAEMTLEPGKGTSSYKVALPSAAKSKTKPAPLEMSRNNTAPLEKDKDKTVTTPKAKIGHRRVGETGETLYKKTPSSALMSAIQLGIGFSVGRLSAKPERDVLMQDFALVETVDFPSGGSRETPAHGFSDFSFKTYAPVAFRYFRELFNMKPEDFLVAVCNEPLQELSNSGASGSLFYVTNDDEFIIKTVQYKEAEFLQKLLPGYYLNLNQNKRTLLPKFFGLYCYQCSGKNIRLAVMNNLIPREFKIHLKYDLKGSTYKRKASKAERAKSSPTLKDLDFINDHPEGLFLESETYNAVIKIIQRDCRVLESFKIMDYSLLLGIHNLDEAAREAAPEKAFTPSGQVALSSEYPQTPQSPDEGPGPTRPTLSRSRSVKGREGFSSEWEAITLKDTEERPVGGIPARNSKGERLLLFIGIIDILQSYRLKKKLEHGWKSLVHDGDTVSVHRPGFYSKRFQEFFANQIFKKIPGKDKISPRRKSVNRTRSLTETERLRPELRREHSFEGSTSERKSRANTDITEDPAKTKNQPSNAKENLEGKFDSAAAARSSDEAAHSSDESRTADKKVAFVDPKEGTSNLDLERIDINITENQTTTTKSHTAVSNTSETNSRHILSRVDAPTHVLVADSADNAAAPLAPSEEDEIIEEDTKGANAEKDVTWQNDGRTVPGPESTMSS